MTIASRILYKKWLISSLKSGFRRRCRLPMAVPWHIAVPVGKRKLLLLCVILTALGFLWIHYSTSSGGASIVIDDFTVATNIWYSNQSIQTGLYRQYSMPSNAQSTTINDILNRRAEKTKNGQKCTIKKFDVSFLKVHKAGSTTLMNIFLRFAIENRLNIVLPRKSKGYAFNYLGYGKTLSREKIIPLPVNESYNILCNHVVYNREAFHSILPNDTVYIGIIREPVSHFKSAASYYGFYKHLRNISEGRVPNERIVGEFLKNNLHAKIPTDFVHNKMSLDFGIPKLKFQDDIYVDEYIKELGRDFSLVLIMEHFQESLVLMKRILCWNTKDILYVPLNAMKNKPPFDLDSDDIDNLRKWNSADFKLYDYFYNVFVAKFASYGEELKEEVDNFKSIQEEVKTFCNKTKVFRDTKSILTFPVTKWGDSFNITLMDCKLMMEPEVPMMQRLIENAWSRYNASVAEKSLNGISIVTKGYP